MRTYFEPVHSVEVLDPYTLQISSEHVETLKAQNPRAQIMTGKETTPCPRTRAGSAKTRWPAGRTVG